MSERHRAARQRAVQQVSDYLAAMLEEPNAFRGQQVRGAGPVAEFETILADRCGFSFCLATSNATAALQVTVLAADLAGREVIVPPHSWGGTYGPFAAAGAKLVWAESDEDGNIQPECIAKLISPATAAVVAADWKGVRHQAKAVKDACAAAGVLYIEDTSFIPEQQSDPAACSLADIQIISFGPGKALSLGEGGALLTRHRRIYERGVAISQHPERSRNEMLTDLPEYPFLNARIHPVSAILGHALLTQ